MAKGEETKDLATITGAALLDHVITSVQNQLKEVLEGSLSLDAHSIANISINVSKLRTIIGYTSANKQTSQHLVKCANLLIRQLHRPHEYRPLTLTLINKVQQAINWAIQGHFSVKEGIQDSALLSILSNVRVLKQQNLIPEKVLKIIQGEEDD